MEGAVSEIQSDFYWARWKGEEPPCPWEPVQMWEDDFGTWVHFIGDEDPCLAEDMEFGPRLTPPGEDNGED
jgi:hypothetical protein